jgi:hypothetical protein
MLALGVDQIGGSLTTSAASVPLVNGRLPPWPAPLGQSPTLRSPAVPPAHLSPPALDGLRQKLSAGQAARRRRGTAVREATSSAYSWTLALHSGHALKERNVLSFAGTTC